MLSKLERFTYTNYSDMVTSNIPHTLKRHSPAGTLATQVTPGRPRGLRETTWLTGYRENVFSSGLRYTEKVNKVKPALMGIGHMFPTGSAQA